MRRSHRLSHIVVYVQIIQESKRASNMTQVVLPIDGSDSVLSSLRIHGARPHRFQHKKPILEYNLFLGGSKKFGTVSSM